jgi:hypothetical protein
MAAWLWTKAVATLTMPKAREVAGRNQPGPIHLQQTVAGISKMMYEM